MAELTGTGQFVQAGFIRTLLERKEQRSSKTKKEDTPRSKTRTVLEGHPAGH
jgi:hypothetical protein